MYTLNLLFDLNEAQGVFSPDQGGPAGGSLLKSATWLKLPQPGPPASAETANWENLDKARNLYLPNAIGQVVGVRVAPIPNMNPALAAGATVTLLVGFGAPRIAAQRNSSPFKQATGETLSGFTFTSPMNSAPPGSAPVAWFFPLADIQVAPNHINKPHRYEFTVCVIVTSGATVRTYGIDPEMDVGL